MVGDFPERLFPEHDYPETVTFTLRRKKGQAPTIVILRDGSLKPKKPIIKVRHVTVLVVEGPKGGRTRAQYKATVQLVRVALQQHCLAKIIFEEGASPWANDFLPRYDEKWTTVLEAMRMRPTTYDKVLLRKKPLHPVIRQKRDELRQGLG